MPGHVISCLSVTLNGSASRQVIIVDGVSEVLKLAFDTYASVLASYLQGAIWTVHAQMTICLHVKSVVFGLQHSPLYAEAASEFVSDMDLQHAQHVWCSDGHTAQTRVSRGL
jgi:hypothetical protein